MLAFRDAHVAGATRVSVAGQHLLTGGADGVVALYATRLWPGAAPLWSIRCHDGAVTDVLLADSLELAITCGRDGRILLHECPFDSATLVSRVVCQVTGEVRCLQLDAERRRLYIAGDSLRCLDMSLAKFHIRTVPLVVPHPLVALAVSPCGRLIAMASASGELGVVPAETSAAATAAPLVFSAALSPTARRNDAAMYRMSWCPTTAVAGGPLLLMVPTATEVQVYSLDRDGGVATTPSRMRAVGGLHDSHLVDLHGALAYPVSKARMACVLVSHDAVFVGKVEGRSLSMLRHTSERYDGAAVTDVQVNAVSGDVVVGLADGRVSLLRRAALKAWRPSSAPAASGASALDEDKDDAGEDSAASQEPPQTQASNTPAPRGEVRRERHAQRREAARLRTRATQRAARNNNNDDDDGFINDDDDDDDASESSVDSEASSSASSDSDVAREDFAKVVVDLTHHGASLRGNDRDRPSRWRDGNDAAALAHAEREAERQQGGRSRFLDDEAEEATTSEEEAEWDGNGSGGERRGPRRHRRRRATATSAEDEEDEEEGDGASVLGHAEEEDGAGAEALQSTAAAARAGVSAPAFTRGVVDYSLQVGATPVGEGGSCYLAYNSVGYIHCSREATTVHFHDVSYPAVRVQLRDTILMGALSPVGAAFIVVPADPAEGQGSVDESPRLSVFYHAFTALGAQAEWRVALLPGETVRCVAAGIRYVAVATSHYLRILSLSGLELAVLSKCHRIVAMVGTSSRALLSSFKADFDPLAIIALTGTGELVMEVIDVGARTAALAPRAVPLTELPDGSTHQLQWFGWSEDGLLHVADTAGVVRVYTESWGGSWVPVYDPRTLADQSDALWIYGVSESALLAYRYSRNDPSYPAAAASGLSTELVPLLLPLTRTMGEDGLERWDRLLRQQLRSDELKRHSSFYSATIAKYDEVHDHHLLHYFDAALKGQQTTRAMELAMHMEVYDRIVKCAQVANTSGYAKLVPKLLALYEMRVASKQRRRCKLPTKEQLASDKKKDDLLQRLLAQNAKAKSAAGDAVEGDREAVAAPTSPPRALAAAAVSPSAASTATTVDVDGASAPVRRHISFSNEAAAPPRPPPTQPPPAPPAAPVLPSAMPAPSRKVVNPFSKSPAPPASTAPHGDAARRTLLPPPSPPTQHQTRLPTPTLTLTPAAATASANRVLGSSPPPPQPTPPRVAAGIAARATTTAVAAAVESEAATDVSPAVTVSPGGSRASAAHTATPSPPRASALVAQPHHDSLQHHHHRDGPRSTAPSPNAFVARELPTSTATAPADPFLLQQQQQPPLQSVADVGNFSSLSGGGAAAGTLISVHSLLDVGHGDATPVVRSDSFGEALRKRYRDDEDEDDDDDVGDAPATTLPRLSVS
ncbi:WD repeat and HMG-box DNA-binding protein [Novymonas esmeraldas]|uniref:WD repeat and HMG-box DNA-binding protein n=1 Tax=Novymonas esmeraldas TaxID=1808958 RepID=A0AAW0EXE6_9TRYP